MIKRWTQAIIMATLLNAFSNPCLALVTNKDKAESKAGAAGAGGDAVVSVDSLVDSIKNRLDGWFSTDHKASVGATEKPEAANGKNITPTRLDIGAKPKDTTPPAPYKIYQTPFVSDESTHQPSPGQEEPRYDDADLSQPPNLPPNVRRQIKLLADSLPNNAIVERGANIMAPASSPVRRSLPTMRNRTVPSISELPKQFFPIFPLGATEDTPAQLLPVVSNIELETDHSMTTRAIIFIHDLQRNSGEGVATLMTLSGSEDEPPLILAPQFSLQTDITRFAQNLPAMGHNVSRWSLDDAWQWGGVSTLQPHQRGVSSFTAMDLLLLFLDDKGRFPSLQQVVIVGHGMGADFVHRYATLGQAPDILEKEHLLTRFIVANPSSFLYLTHERPAQASHGLANSELKTCPKMLDYPYGSNNMIGYAKSAGLNAIRMRYPERRVLYLVGDSMINDIYLDNSCQAVAQGGDRTERTKLFGRFMERSFGDTLARNQLFKIVPKAGYDFVSLIGSPCGMAVLFGASGCDPKGVY